MMVRWLAIADWLVAILSEIQNVKKVCKTVQIGDVSFLEPLRATVAPGDLACAVSLANVSVSNAETFSTLRHLFVVLAVKKITEPTGASFPSEAEELTNTMLASLTPLLAGLRAKSEEINGVNVATGEIVAITPTPAPELLAAGWIGVAITVAIDTIEEKEV